MHWRRSVSSKATASRSSSRSGSRRSSLCSAVSAAGGVLVPINPLLRPPQVGYILRDCDVRVLVTTSERLALLAAILDELSRGSST